MYQGIMEFLGHTQDQVYVSEKILEVLMCVADFIHGNHLFLRSLKDK